MTKIHIVQEGEHLASIAVQHGFHSIKSLWDHPDNAELKKLRPNPNTLVPGDKIVIPKIESRNEQGSTEQRVTFVRSAEPLKLRVKVLDHKKKAIRSQCELQVGAISTLMEFKKNVHETDVDIMVRFASLRFPGPNERLRPDILLAVGSLQDIKQIRGQRQRLNNLGYFAGFSRKEEMDEQFKWAVQEFQCDHPPLEIDGECGPKTRKKLEEVHGS